MSQIVDLARTWLGTPYIHQASCKGAGCDCLGLVLGLWRELYGALPAPVPAYTPDWSEVSGEERLWQAAITHLVEKPIADAVPGDVILFRMRSGAVAKHIGIQTVAGAAPRFLHAYTGQGVTEGALTSPWARRIAARFAFPERT
ncbi:NlpC/P60 family protein [Gymnodinialimonas sp. 2305UL16-5]|uniref:NlpC/P60 family protein n=1 Tax=Gymnodinialimonas mytili TaxID=3126503 RepID=UPI00309B6A0A